MPTMNKRTFPGNEARNELAMTIARRIELQATQTIGRGKKARTTVSLRTLVRDDLHWTVIFVSDATTGHHCETVTVYENGKTARHGSFRPMAVDRALAFGVAA
jgi:hypothetical protein